jgi:hypothetical protein
MRINLQNKYFFCCNDKRVQSLVDYNVALSFRLVRYEW